MTQTQKLTPEQCALLCDVLRSLQHELEALTSKAEALDRAGLDNCLTTAEAERLRFLAAVIADLLALIAKCGCVCADCDDGMSAPPALGPSP